MIPSCLRAMNEARWYTRINASARLTQGDLVLAYPLLRWKEAAIQFQGADELDVLEESIAPVRADVIVMSQACDLEHDKVSNVILCIHYSLDQYHQDWSQLMQAQSQTVSKKAWDKQCEFIRSGYVWNLAMLNNGTYRKSSLGYRIVDFHEVYTMPRIFLESYLGVKADPRWRLLSPYREHLSQAFARFFMRIGLPQDIRLP